MKVDELIKLCLINNDAEETKPFQRKEYKDISVIRHKSNNKWFALVSKLNNKLSINLKCPPELNAALKEQYPAIKPAWHMNKKHWCTVEVNNIPLSALEELIKISFELTAPKKKARHNLH